LEPRTEPDDATRKADESDADRNPAADRAGTKEEENAADAAYAASDAQERRDVADHEEEMMEIGAHVKGEGEI
jgi:hypothetical protein